MAIRADLRGVVTPLVTPLDDSGEIDGESLCSLIDFQIASGIGGLFILGTNGEGVLLSDAQRREVAQTASQHVRGRVPLLCAVSNSSLPRALTNLRGLADCDIDACVSSLPYYQLSSPSEQLAFFRALSDECSRPLLVYNIPTLVKVAVDLGVVKRLAEEGRIAGIKESSYDVPRFRELIELKSIRLGFATFSGASDMMDVAYRLGFDGVVVGIANVLPGLCARMWSSWQASEFEEAESKYAVALKLFRWMDTFRKARGWGSTQAISKAVLKEMGIIRSSKVVEPYASADDRDIPEVQHMVRLITRESGGASVEALRHERPADVRTPQIG